MRPHFKPRFRRPFRPGGGPPPGGKPPHPTGGTMEEVRYLKHLIERQTPVCVKLRNNEEVRGFIEYYDTSFIRVTRKGDPNLFIFKHEIKYIYEDRR